MPEDKCKKFAESACPHSWLLAADNLHSQALQLYGQRGQTTLTCRNLRTGVIEVRDGVNKSVFLLGGFAIENAIKAFLVYENPNWISNGRLARSLRSHKLINLRRQSRLAPYNDIDDIVLVAFENGLESWARYPCALSADDVRLEKALDADLWSNYIRLMSAYGDALRDLLSISWNGPHGIFARYEIDAGFLSFS